MCTLMWRILESETVHHCLFQCGNESLCEGCNTYIPSKALKAKVENGTKYYHFDCFWRFETTAKCKKDEIMIAVEKITAPRILMFVKTFRDKQQYASLETLDKEIHGINAAIAPEDIERIREHVALAQDGKTPYYLPDVVQKHRHSCSYCKVTESGCEPDKDCQLKGIRLDKAFYHPHCLAESGFVNINSDEIEGYAALDEDMKESLDGLFEKDDKGGIIFMAETKIGLEHCSFKSCQNQVIVPSKKKRQPVQYRPSRAIQSGDLRIRYGPFSYHPKCFVETGKVNVDGKDIRNYDKLDESNKAVLDECFVKSDVFDVPLVGKADKNGYCNAAECLVSQSLSRFPYPYTITHDQLQIHFQGDVYHPTCFNASVVSNISAEEMRNYESLTDDDKKIVDGIFKKAPKRKSTEDQSTVGSQDGGEPSLKKNRLSEEDGTVEIKQEVLCLEISQTVDICAEKHLMMKSKFSQSTENGATSAITFEVKEGLTSFESSETVEEFVNNDSSIMNALERFVEDQEDHSEEEENKEENRDSLEIFVI